MSKLMRSLAAAAVLLVGCSSDGSSTPPTVECGPSNCQGCCDNGACMAGTTADACGVAGGACQTCSKDAPQCVSGNCEKQQPTCDSSNCAGCCMNGTCQAGTTTAACGKAGASCTTCQNNQICRTDQACGVDPNSKWKVQPTSATITPTNNGSSWDSPDSPPDVVVHVVCPPSSQPIASVTPEVESYSPTWSSGGCVTTASALLQEQWTYWLLDVDVASDDTITEHLNYQFTEQDFVAGSITLPAAGGMVTMSVQLQKQ